MKTKIHFSCLTVLLFIFTVSLNAQTINLSYVIEENDWLSKISEKVYNNPHLYHRIIEGTNEKAKSDKSFRPIAHPNNIKIGQKIWIPEFNSNVGGEAQKNEKIKSSGTNLWGVPKTNCEIRLWYNYQVVAIVKINEKWVKDGFDLETRAHKAYAMRREARLNARFMMQNPAEVKALEARDIARYGNPDGPTFEYLLNKNMDDKGMTKDEALQAIIESAARTDQRYNQDCM